jgi:hypothetical protein
MSEKEPHLQVCVIKAIREEWSRNPNMRLNQLLVNAIAPQEPCPEIFLLKTVNLSNYWIGSLNGEMNIRENISTMFDLNAFAEPLFYNYEGGLRIG